MRFRIIGQVKKIELEGIKVITEKGHQVFMLKQNDPYGVNFDELNLEVETNIMAIVGAGRTQPLSFTSFDLVSEDWQIVVADSIKKLSLPDLIYLEEEQKLMDALQEIYDDRYSQNPDPDSKLLGFEQERIIRNSLDQLHKKHYKIQVPE